MDADVIVAGAGPNGLMLAAELALAGARPLVLERLSRPSTEPKANGLVGQVVRMLDRRGLYEQVGGSPGPPRPSRGYMFGGLPLDLAALADNPLYVQPLPQARLTQILAGHAAGLGVEIRYGHEVSALAQDDDAVTATVTGPQGAYTLRAGYLAGADGGHSTVRKLSGIAFPGITEDDRVSRSATAQPPAAWIDPHSGTLTVPGYGPVPLFAHHRTDRGTFSFAPFPGRLPMVHTTEWGGVEPGAPDMTIEEMQASIHRVLGAEVPLTEAEGPGPRMLRRLAGGSTRLAERYRDRRILLVGDAAHVHSAVGGPGLNLGLLDAVNLGWKLAAVAAGRAPSALLDTYESERRPVAARVTMHTQAQSALLAPGSDVTALRVLFGELLTAPDTVQRIADLLAGADVRYVMPQSPDGGAETGTDTGTGAAGVLGGHRLVGRSAPELDLDLGTRRVRLAELTRTARPLLIDLTDDGAPAEALAPHADHVDVHRARLCRQAPDAVVAAGTVADDAVPVTAMLVRPDAYVAWASSSGRPAATELDALRHAAHHWFGRLAVARPTPL